jgi:hypothetical protein
MKKAIVIFVLSTFLVTGLVAQDCPLFYPDIVNSQIEYKQYDKKGNLTSSSIQKITNVKKTGSGYVVEVAAETFDAKGKSLGTTNLTARCEAGIYYIDMKNLMGSMEAYKDYEMKMEGGNLELPASMKAGDMLKDGSMKISFSSNGMNVMNMAFTVTNRKVVGIETITTPAGTFECYKISYDMATKMMINVKTKATEWYAKGTGLIKSESYSTDGKILSTNVLTSIKK